MPGVLCFKVWGLVGALVVVALFAALSWGLRSWWKVPGLTLIEPVSYYWMMFAILTWLWEICFISFKFRETRTYADYLMAADKHVWLTSYGWQMILPWNTAVVFYAEYGAWADRDYSALKLDENLWARAIEGSHGFAAGGFSLLAMIFAAQFSQAQLLITMSVGMAAQGMNAFLYLASCECRACAAARAVSRRPAPNCAPPHPHHCSRLQTPCLSSTRPTPTTQRRPSLAEFWPGDARSCGSTSSGWCCPSTS